MEIVVNFDDICGECPVWDEAAGSLYWTDCGGLRFSRYEAASGRAEILNEGIEINGFRLNEPGGFAITNNSGIWLWDGKSEPALIVTEVDGAACRMNDCTADPAGRLISGSWFYDPAGGYPTGKLISVYPNGKAAILDDGFQLSNGLAFSPDYSVLYAADSALRVIYSYSYDVNTGKAGNRRTFVAIPSTEGLPDGLAVDQEGYVWTAQWYGSCVVRYDPDGTVERRITTPAKQTSSLAFGGADLSELFITTAARSEPMPLMPPGYDPESGTFGGPLYRARPGIRGLEQCHTRFSPAWPVRKTAT
jgi:sugar lactone lactonase YvrE